MSEPTYRIAQRLLASRAAVGVKQYGDDLTANSPGCMLVHALEEAADQVNYLLAEIQRRREVIQTLCDLTRGGKLPDHEADTVADIGYVIDLLGGDGVLKQYNEILGGGTVAENATVDPRDEALRVAAGKIHHWHDWGDNNEGMVVSSAAVRELWDALAAIRGAR